MLEAVNPVEQLKLSWVPCALMNADIRGAFVNYDNVKSVSREIWTDPELGHIETMPRVVKLRLKRNVSPTDLPHLVIVRGTQVLVLCRDRPHLCLRCKDCRVPFCNCCRQFGHDASVCLRAYASAVLGKDPAEEHMDEGMEGNQLM